MREPSRVGAEANKMADAARGADGGGVDHLRIELHEQVVREQRLANGCALPALHFSSVITGVRQLTD